MALTVASSLVTPLAFPQVSCKPLAWLGVAPFLLALRRASLREAALLGLVWTLVFSITVGHWLPGGLSFYFDHPPVFGWLAFLAVLVVMVVPYVVAFAVVYPLLARRFDATLPFWAAAAWVAAEWSRGTLFTLTGAFASLPWALLGYSQAGIAPLVQIASVTGVYGVSFVLMVGNATLADLAFHATARRIAWPAATLRLATAAVPALAALAFGAVTLRGAPDPGAETEGATVAVVQGHIGLAERWHRHFHGRNLGTYLRLSDEVLAQSGAELVVWPEAAMTFFLEEQPHYRASIRSLLRSRDVQLVSGVPRQGARDETYFNSVYLLSREAEVLDRYDKQYLLPFAEYVPLGSSELMKNLFGRFREFSFGGAGQLLATRIGPAGAMVCNEAVLPGAARRRVRDGATFLVNPSNDSWSRHPNFTGQWFDIVTFRAIEQRRYLVRASTSGPSGIIDPWGRPSATTERFTRGVTAGRIQPRSEISIYGRVGDLFALLCGLALVGALLVPRRRVRSADS
jgi:apolipoprotein N-acyltransferase